MLDLQSGIEVSRRIAHRRNHHAVSDDVDRRDFARKSDRRTGAQISAMLIQENYKPGICWSFDQSPHPPWSVRFQAEAGNCLSRQHRIPDRRIPLRQPRPPLLH